MKREAQAVLLNLEGGTVLKIGLASPAINQVVLVSTAVAFAARPSMVLARLLASLLTATTTGWLWLRGRSTAGHAIAALRCVCRGPAAAGPCATRSCLRAGATLRHL